MPDKKIITEVNDLVNRRSWYKTDMELYGTPEFWTEILEGGDCEDFALGKRREFLNRGVPVEKLRLCCCFTETPPPNYHAVLVVTDDDGNDWILDNRFAHPMSRDEAERGGYVLEKIQNGSHWEWVTPLR